MSAPRPFISALVLSAIASAPVAAFDLVGFNDAPVAADDAVVKGWAQYGAAKAGDDYACILSGVVRAKASGAIAAGGKVIAAGATDAQSVKAAGAGVNIVGTALAAAADGDFVDILIR